MSLLTEKYRPKEFSDVIGNVDVIHLLEGAIRNIDMPHLLFTGPPGTGKTTSAKILASKLINNNEYVLELNASDERGIDVVRSTIKNFSRKKSIGVPFKLIILDEADSMTIAAQQAMRRVMEIYSNDCRFILICNDFNKIFEPIQSRCAVLLFEKIKEEEIISRVKEIVEKEKIKITSKGIETLVSLANGDLRQSINILQSIQNLPFVSDEHTISEVTGLPSPIIIKKILKNLMDKNIDEALKLFDEMWDNKYDPSDIITSFFRVSKKTNNYNLLKAIGLTHLKIVEGINSKIQFYGLFYDILNVKK
ncbi:Replication factor C [Spraguea lophii 42_110]|uniref:Replication factor C n=1 Tax=Spraguea lophii (strain 42_110) TaxID=1358809 RepID=S7XJV8_SPRLO|nr:Replication factor C [Spraguea lophii 42_110]